MTYLAQSGPVYPARLEDDLCGDCGQASRLSGDWLCANCRHRLSEALRQIAVASGSKAALLAWGRAELDWQMGDPDEELPF